MGQAKNRKFEIDALKNRTTVGYHAWQDQLSPEEKLVFEVAHRFYSRIIIGHGLTEACYQIAFFLNKYLRERHRTETEIVVGWINDGTWPGVASHAWLSYQGKMIDIALNKTSFPKIQPPGDLIILDRAILPGRAKYSYYLEVPQDADRYMRTKSITDPQFARNFDHKNSEHARMKALSASIAGTEEYLAMLPPGMSYGVMSSLMDA